MVAKGHDQTLFGEIVSPTGRQANEVFGDREPPNRVAQCRLVYPGFFFRDWRCESVRTMGILSREREHGRTKPPVSRDFDVVALSYLVTSPAIGAAVAAAT